MFAIVVAELASRHRAVPRMRREPAGVLTIRLRRRSAASKANSAKTVSLCGAKERKRRTLKMNPMSCAPSVRALRPGACARERCQGTSRFDE